MGDLRSGVVWPRAPHCQCEPCTTWHTVSSAAVFFNTCHPTDTTTDVCVCGCAWLVQLVLEGPEVNLGVTSPAATMALMLMFLRTHDTAAASAFSLPTTRYALSRTQPDLVVLRVLGRALVMWDSVAPSREWISAQMPPIAKVSKHWMVSGAHPPAAVSSFGRQWKTHYLVCHSLDRSDVVCGGADFALALAPCCQKVLSLRFWVESCASGRQLLYCCEHQLHACHSSAGSAQGAADKDPACRSSSRGFWWGTEARSFLR